ncbi:hypothetical protein ED312_01520 [Sinomicrobium pectinilyticum]|uniref:Uncharacterized protein n=1 Tax=Sinomicrobium pectinilyticum TaxID=1084421 RepID=A0A3N0F3A2_SINP1|nr:hypothetical protein ED312_01520 [Sinomicrobium pectinilyticum]
MHIHLPFQVKPAFYLFQQFEVMIDQLYLDIPASMYKKIIYQLQYAGSFLSPGKTQCYIRFLCKDFQTGRKILNGRRLRKFETDKV